MANSGYAEKAPYVGDAVGEPMKCGLSTWWIGAPRPRTALVASKNTWTAVPSATLPLEVLMAAGDRDVFRERSDQRREQDRARGKTVDGRRKAAARMKTTCPPEKRNPYKIGWRKKQSTKKGWVKMQLLQKQQQKGGFVGCCARCPMDYVGYIRFLKDDCGMGEADIAYVMGSSLTSPAKNLDGCVTCEPCRVKRANQLSQCRTEIFQERWDRFTTASYEWHDGSTIKKKPFICEGKDCPCTPDYWRHAMDGLELYESVPHNLQLMCYFRFDAPNRDHVKSCHGGQSNKETRLVELKRCQLLCFLCERRRTVVKNDSVNKRFL